MSKWRKIWTNGFQTRANLQNQAVGWLRQADVAAFYCAGHGIQVNGRNWLIPTTAKLVRV